MTNFFSLPKTIDAPCSFSPFVDCWPASTPQQLLPPQLPTPLLFIMMPYGMAHSFGQFESHVLVLSSPSSFYSPCWQGR